MSGADDQPGASSERPQPDWPQPDRAGLDGAGLDRAVQAGASNGSVGTPSAGDPSVEDRDLFGRRPVGRPDWSHRRGEPRYFALLWTVVLMICTGMLFASVVGGSGVRPEVYRAAARVTLVTVLAAALVLWPMIRLSQVRPRRVVRSVLGDLLVVLLPLQAVVWPQQLLAGWRSDTVAVLACWTAAWLLVVGALLAGSMALVPPGDPEAGGFRRGVAVRVLGQVLAVGVVAGLPLVLVLAGVLEIDPGREPSVAVRPGWMATPLSGAWEILRDRSGSGAPAQVLVEHWLAVRMVLGAAILAWVSATVALLVGPRNDS